LRDKNNYSRIFQDVPKIFDQTSSAHAFCSSCEAIKKSIKLANYFSIIFDNNMRLRNIILIIMFF